MPHSRRQSCCICHHLLVAHRPSSARCNISSSLFEQRELVLIISQSRLGWDYPLFLHVSAAPRVSFRLDKKMVPDAITQRAVSFLLELEKRRWRTRPMAVGICVVPYQPIYRHPPFTGTPIPQSLRIVRPEHLARGFRASYSDNPITVRVH